jgi:hypothetical protein
VDREVQVMKFKGIAFVLVVFFSLSLDPFLRLHEVHCDELDVIEVENPSDLLSHVTALDMRLEDYEGKKAFFGYEIIGEEILETVDTWIVRWNYSSAGGEKMNDLMVWVSKSDGIVVQVEIEGQKITDSSLTASVANMTFGFFMGVVYYSWETWGYNNLMNLPHGKLIIIGNETVQYGPTTFQIFKYQFTGEENSPEQYRYNVEAWVALTQFGSIITRLFVESILDDKWFRFNVDYIELAEAQETADEPTLEEEPDVSPEEQERKRIPGFPLVAVYLGMLMLTLFRFIRTRKLRNAEPARFQPRAIAHRRHNSNLKNILST